MSNVTSVINVNVPSDVKEKANKIFNNLGLDMNSAINLFLKRVIIEKGIPFEVRLKPSSQLKEALNEMEQIKKHPEKYTVYHNVDNMLENVLKK